MPRPKRPNWSKLTLTLSDEVSREIRVRSAILGIEMGTLVDAAIRDLPGFPTTPQPEALPGSPGAQSLIADIAEATATRENPRAKAKGNRGEPEPVGGGRPSRIAEFICNGLFNEKPLAILLPLQHLAVSNDGSVRGITQPKLKAMIVQAVKAIQDSGFVIGSTSDAMTIKVVNGILQSADQAAFRLLRLFRVNAEWREIWKRDAAAAYGTVIGQLVAECVKDLPVEDAATGAGDVLARMIKTVWDRRGHDYTEFIAQGHELMVGELFERDPRIKRRQPQESEPWEAFITTRPS